MEQVEQTNGEGRYTVKTDDGREAIVEVGGREGLSITLYAKSGTDNYSFAYLLQRARENTLPRWAQQVKPLVERIEAIFEKERAAGRDPHRRVGINQDEVFSEDLPRGIGHSRKLSDLREDLARGRKLPVIFDVPSVRAALGLEAKAA